MLEGVFVTVVGFKNNRESGDFAIGGRLICVKDPQNPHDDDAIRVVNAKGETVGYLSNSGGTKAGGTLSASRIYDKVGNMFSIEVCFTTRTKVICRLMEPDLA